MPPIVCIVGASKSGKTTLIEKLTPEFKRRGYRIATVKHVPHQFDLDVPGKDSWRHIQAGSECVLLSSPAKLALIRELDHDLNLVELEQFLGDFDLVLAEGFKRGRKYKVEVHRRGLGELTCPPEELLAVVTDEPLDLDIPQFSPEDVPGLAQLIEERVMAREEDEVRLFVDGKPIPLIPFPREVILRVNLALASTLKGVKELRRMNLWIKRKGK
ncbi:MAG: molybdopterin-guanine dinucleotide biosynthesis protein B [Chloroflexi bacterium]|nr:MAG: molybdopterin-guanine dinucleotide biosynthesis protein B [Chloroflexota bacterium]